MAAKVNGLSWGEIFVIASDQGMTDKEICQYFGKTLHELYAARSQTFPGGLFYYKSDIDVTKYRGMFSVAAPTNQTSTTTKIVKNPSTTTTVVKPSTSTSTPLTATKKVKPVQKRGRKGSRISNAFKAIPNDPTPAEQFVFDNNISLAVLRQSGRFDTQKETGKVHVKKVLVGDTKVLSVWRDKVNPED